MKRILLLILVAAFPAVLFAQKFAYVNTEYIMNKIPNYKIALEQIESTATKYQREIEEGYRQLDEQFRSLQAEKALLNESMRKSREDAIIARERELRDLQQRYFGPEGEVFRKREELIKPLQDQVTAAINTFATEGGYTIVFDIANNGSILYTNPRSDMSDKILEKLGFK